MTIAQQKIVELPSLDIEQKLLADQFFSMFDLGEGANFNIDGFTPLLYEGPTGGSEFLVYDANKLYLCFSIFVGYSGAATANVGLFLTYNELNVINLYLGNNSIAYESVAAVIFYAKNPINIENLFFSRIGVGQYNYMKFIGYRVTY